MIYKFIDNNGSEITVNSISSLQTLVDSETVKKDTKVKAGLRGNWTTAKNIPELDFEEKKEETIEEITEPEEDIKTFIAKEEIKEDSKKEIIKESDKDPKEEIKTKEPEESVKKETEEDVEITPQEELEQDNIDTTDYYTEKTEKSDNKYNNANVIGLNFFQAVKTCLRKYFEIEGRASRSEYWYFSLFVFILGLIIDYLDAVIAGVPWLEYEVIYGPLSIILTIVTFMPGITVSIRRLHDLNKSGWWLLIAFTVIGLIPLFIWFVSKGTQGKNRFGNYPLKLKKD